MSTSGVSPDEAEEIRLEQVAEIDRYYSALSVRGGRNARTRLAARHEIACCLSAIGDA